MTVWPPPAALAAAMSWAQSLEEPAEEAADSAKNLAETFIDATPRVGIGAGIVLVGYLLSRLLRAVLHHVFSRRQTPSFARVMSKVGGWLLLLVAVLSATAVTFPSVKPVDLLASLGFFSVAVGFAFQDILENTLSGVLLLFRQPFESGDQIEVEGRAGTVQAITIRETRLQTFDGQLVVIPNRDVYKNAIRVQTHYSYRRLSFLVGIAYENDATDACTTIVDALGQVDGIARIPTPEALVTELGVSTVDIEARFWSDPRQQEAALVLDDAIRTVKLALDAAGIEMPAEIIALQATPSFKAALQNEYDVTPGGGVLADGPSGAPRGGR